MSSKAIFVVNTYTKAEDTRGFCPDKKYPGLYNAINNLVIPSQKKYAADCGADYIEIKDTEKITGRPWLDACWRNLTILQDMVDSPYSEILFLDCDIVIEDCAPDIFNNTYSGHPVNKKNATVAQDRLKSLGYGEVEKKYMHNTCCVLYTREIFELYSCFLKLPIMEKIKSDFISGSFPNADMDVMPIICKAYDSVLQTKLNIRYNALRPEGRLGALRPGNFWEKFYEEGNEAYFTHYVGQNKKELVERYLDQ